MLKKFCKKLSLVASYSVLVTCLIGLTDAAAFQYELIRTAEEPGFFMVRVYPDNTLPAFDLETVYVKNFPRSQKRKYNEVVQTIEELGAPLITPEDLAQLDLTNKRIFVLGETISDFPTLNLHETDRPIESFETFLAKHVSPVIIKNLKAQFGGNTSEVFSDEVKFVTNEPITFVGKFEKARKTRLALTADTVYGPVELTTPLDLETAESQNDPVAKVLPEIWESYQPVIEPAPTKQTFWQSWWRSFLPTLLIGLALVCFYIVIRWIWLAKKNEDQQREIFLDDVPPSIVRAPDFLESGLPFEIEFKPKENH